jgi:hypothetical protein
MNHLDGSNVATIAAMRRALCGSVNPVATSNDARAVAQHDQPIWMIDAVEIVQTQSNRKAVIAGEHAIDASILAAVL